jgi:radical SAM protein with 4Fe4S-binding SPASM domain
LANLKDIYSYPYLPLSEDEYKNWFNDFVTPVGENACCNIENLIDIQPTGEANFCVDAPDYSFGNARENTIKELWNNEQAKAFREFRRNKVLSACHRCVARYMSVNRN